MKSKVNYILFLILFIGSCTLKTKSSETAVKSSVAEQMKELIAILKADAKSHHNVGPRLTDAEIEQLETRLQLTFPASYKLFLKEFGDGAYWLYSNPVNRLNEQQNFFLGQYRKELGETIELVEEKEVYQRNSLLFLMAEDSNGGAWVWLTSEDSGNGEWPLAYYSLSDKKLHYKVDNFVEWLRLLVKGKYEVIRMLDVDNKLGLG